LPFSGCESGRLRKRPPAQAAFGHVEPTGGERISVRLSSGRKRDFGQRIATGEEGVSAPTESGRTGFRPGSCETGGTQGFGSWTAKTEPRLRPRILSFPVPMLRQRFRDVGKKGGASLFRIRRAANRQGSGPVGEPAGAPAAALAVDGIRRKRRLGFGPCDATQLPFSQFFRAFDISL
jgi:hypothetical protein